MAGTEMIAIVLLVIVLSVALVGSALIIALLAGRPRQQIASPTPLPMPYSKRQSAGVGVHYRSVTPSALQRTEPRGLPTPPRHPDARRSPRIMIHNGPLRGSFYSLARPTLAIGRGDICTIALPDPRVSRQHLRIEWRSDGLYLVDTHSTNGTYVNGRRIGHYRLHGGEQVRIGDTLLTIQLD
ncbi:MAG: FHA domain-containing protein [Anaerolineae bacterium]|nr:FHA domain-containing protein [Anaerolineae bacterium]